MASSYVKLGDKANIFHDQSTGLTICKGDVVELTPRQLLQKRVKAAIAAGHLQYTTPAQAKEEKKLSAEESLKVLSKKFKDLYDAGKEPAKIAKAFTLDELKLLAEQAEIQIEKDDTKETIAQAICEEIDESDEE